MDLSKIPSELRALKRFINWKPISGKKIPLGRSGSGAWTTPQHWMSLDEALATKLPIGVILGDGLSGVDLDDAYDSNGNIHPIAQTIITEHFAGAYAERSPSGKGIKIYGRSSKPGLEIVFDKDGSPKAGKIFPPDKSFFALTGEALNGSGFVVIDEGLSFWTPGQNEKPRKAEPLPEVIADGGRNETLFKHASKLRAMGHDEAEILAALKGLNQRLCKPPLADREVEVIAKSSCKYAVKTGAVNAEDPYPATETGDAEHFGSLYGEIVRFDHCKQTFMHFNGHHWTPPTDGAIYRMALDSMRIRLRAAVGDQKRAAWANGGESRRRQKSLLEIVQNLKPVADAGMEWDMDISMLGVANGAVNLRTGELRQGQPSDKITLVSPITYGPNISTTKWERFILDICSGDQDLADYMQTVLGYTLTGETGEQCFWIFWGSGSNGKSTLIETLQQRVLPQHSWTMNFPTSTWSENLSEYQRAMLSGRRLVVAKETEERKRLHTEFMKSLTGDETINARHPRGRPFNFKPIAKFFLLVNHKPVIKDETHGMWRRVRLIPFLRTFPLDPNFAKELAANESCAALTWAIRGAVKYYREGLKTPESVLVATRDFQNESKALAPFIEERCEIAEGLETRASEMFAAYRVWCEGRHLPDLERVSKNDFTARIEACQGVKVHEYPRRHPKRGVAYLGIGLRTGQTNYLEDEQMRLGGDM